MSWILLFAAIAFEVGAMIGLKLSDGFGEVDTSLSIIGLFVLSFICAAYAMKQIDVGLAYSIWSGLGTVAIVGIGILYFNEPSSLIKLSCIAMIVVGVVGLNMMS